MKTLSDLSLLKMCDEPQSKEVVERQDFQDAQYGFLLRVSLRIRNKKQDHLFQVCKIFYIFRLSGSFSADQKHLLEDIDNIPRWKLVHWAAAQSLLDPYDRLQGALWRIRLELPFEHENGRCLEYTMEAFEAAVDKVNPEWKGNVHEWCAVFEHVPSKILRYEDFFG